MIFSPILELLSGGNAGTQRLERVKDDDADPGLGSWVVGDQGSTFAHTGVPGFGGSVTDAFGNLLDAAQGMTPDLDPLNGVTDWLAGVWFKDLIDDWLWTGIFGSTGLVGAWWVSRIVSKILQRPRADAQWKELPVPSQINQQALVQAMRAVGIRCMEGEVGFIWVNAYHLGVAKRFMQQQAVA